MDKNKFKVNDRVKRHNLSGSQGTVKEIREEVTSTTAEPTNGKASMIAVQWDNGTYSYFSPDSLDLAGESGK